MDESSTAGLRLRLLARPFLERDDREGLARALNGTWSPDDLALLLNSDEADAEVLRVSVICLGLIGDMAHSMALAASLHDDDIEIVTEAENALWSIWLRDGGTTGCRILAKVAADIRRGETENVVLLLTELIQLLPDYAEAYHQRSQAHYLENNYVAALRDARRAVELNPWHFAAWAIQAHALVGLGRWSDALAAYREAQALHPRLSGVAEAIERLERRLPPTPLVAIEN